MSDMRTRMRDQIIAEMTRIDPAKRRGWMELLVRKVTNDGVKRTVQLSPGIRVHPLEEQPSSSGEKLTTSELLAVIDEAQEAVNRHDELMQDIKNDAHQMAANVRKHGCGTDHRSAQLKLRTRIIDNISLLPPDERQRLIHAYPVDTQ